MSTFYHNLTLFVLQDIALFKIQIEAFPTKPYWMMRVILLKSRVKNFKGFLRTDSALLIQ